MHPSSIENMKKAVALLNLNNNLNILDVGGRGLGEDRSYYHIFKNIASVYHIADIVPGENVTHIMPSEYSIPSKNEFYDLIVSGQTLEHVKNPFKLVLEMKRVLKTNGFMILIAPSTGPRHDIIDCWRFMDDSFKAIAEETDLKIVANWIDTATDKASRKWNDHVFVGQKI
jgi:SAM-dependent methyltransferase